MPRCLEVPRDKIFISQGMARLATSVEALAASRASLWSSACGQRYASI